MHFLTYLFVAGTITLQIYTFGERQRVLLEYRSEIMDLDNIIESQYNLIQQYIRVYGDIEDKRLWLPRLTFN